MKTIIWGYPGGMRGKHFETICREMAQLAKTCSNCRNKTITSTEFYQDILPAFQKIKGLGISTYSKLLYFLKVTVDGNPCLILDERLINVCKTQ